MSSELTNLAVVLAAITLGTLGAILILAGIAALVRCETAPLALRTLSGLVLLLMGGLAGAVAIGTQGYLALTHEDVAARLFVQPRGPQRFVAMVRFPDGREAMFELAGDEIYVDAHIIKWKPLANILGLHTAYELDRVGGRYRAIEDERSAVRTLYSLAHEKPVDPFGLRLRTRSFVYCSMRSTGRPRSSRWAGPAEPRVTSLNHRLAHSDAIPQPRNSLVAGKKKTGWYETMWKHMIR